MTSLKDTMIPDLKKLNRFNLQVSRIHTGHKELSSPSMDYRKAGLAFIEQGISDTICSLDSDLVPWEIRDQLEAFFHYLDLHVTDDMRFRNYEPDAVLDRALELPEGTLDFLDELLLAADTQAHRFRGTIGLYT